jgi:CBS domain-containing protein
MSSSFFTCNEEDTAERVAEQMAEHRIEQMPVLDAGGRLVGMITRPAAETLTSPSTAQ